MATSNYQAPIRSYATQISDVADTVARLDAMLDDVSLTAGQKTVLKQYFQAKLQAIATSFQSFITGIA